MVILSDRLSFFGVHPELAGVVELWAKRVSEELSWRARPPRLFARNFSFIACEFTSSYR